MSVKPIQIIQGGQWGSEAKGMVAAALAIRDNVDVCVRTGAVNAGHTIWYKGKEYKMQQLPVGWVNPNTLLVIGAGAYIYPEILAMEMNWVREATGEDVRDRLMIDNRASLHLAKHSQRSGDSNRHHLIGATGKGCSEAIVDKISNRGRGYQLFKEWYQGTDARDTLENCFRDTAEILNDMYDRGAKIQLEGTQGSLLDLHLGPYPYTTHKQTQAAQWVVEAGLSPSLAYEVILVLRTYPIRVAGNSGPMPKEIDWSQLARSINKKLVLAGKEELVSEDALKLWDWNCQKIAKEWAEQGDLPGNGNYSFHTWPESWRVQYKYAVSEFHKSVIQYMDPTPAMKELKKLFEMTTVTRKLRRVAMFDMDMAKWSVRVNRPDKVALTFLNYEFPELWGYTTGFAHRDATQYIGNIEGRLGVPVRYTTTGPRDEHFLSI